MYHIVFHDISKRLGRSSTHRSSVKQFLTIDRILLSIDFKRIRAGTHRPQSSLELLSERREEWSRFYRLISRGSTMLWERILRTSSLTGYHSLDLVSRSLEPILQVPSPGRHPGRVSCDSDIPHLVDTSIQKYHLHKI